MTEADFWPRLEYRLCREFKGMRDRCLQWWWCDGFIPSQYLLDDPVPRIIGRVWICFGRAQSEWEFTLFLPGPVVSRGAIDWASLLPPEDVTRWLAFDSSNRRIQIELAVAVPDLPPSTAR